MLFMVFFLKKKGKISDINSILSVKILKEEEMSKETFLDMLKTAVETKDYKEVKDE